jgi:serine/threonine-protein kinase HipA
LREDHAAWRLPRDTGQFSLAGAQPKTALLFENGRWGIPSGRTPTTHVLKPPTGQFDGHAENEHICLALAHAVGLPAASSQVMCFGDEVAIVVDVVELLRTHSSERDEDVWTFISAVGFNWLIAGTDAHAKNYSLLITGGQRVRLRPCLIFLFSFTFAPALSQ